MSTIPKTQFDCATIKFTDATTPTALEVELQLDNGDFGVDNILPNLRNIEAYETRGQLSALRHAGRAYPTFSLSAKMAEFSNDTTGTLLDLLNGTGEFADPAPVSTTTAIGDVMTVDIEFTIDGAAVGEEGDHTITLHDVHITTSFAEGSPNTLSFSGTVYGEISGDVAITPPTCGA